MSNYLNVNKKSKKSEHNAVKVNDSISNCDNMNYIAHEDVNFTEDINESVSKNQADNTLCCCELDQSIMGNCVDINCTESFENNSICNDICNDIGNNDFGCESNNIFCNTSGSEFNDNCVEICENNYTDKCNNINVSKTSNRLKDACDSKCNIDIKNDCNNNCNNKCDENCNYSACCELNNIIESIALQEAGLAHILNAEGEKIQKALTLDVSFNDLISLNVEVAKVIASVTNLEIVLTNKLKTVLDNDCCNKKCSGNIYILVKNCVTGEPISFATIIIKKVGENKQICGETDIFGKYKKCNIPCGKYLVEVSYQNQTKQQDAEITCDFNCISLDYCFNVEKCCGVDLTVTDCATGCALSSVNVTLFDKNNNIIKKGQTDYKGKFYYKCLVFGEYKIVIKDCATVQEIVKNFEVTDTNCSIKLNECFTRCDGNKNVVVSGKVVNRCGSGVPFAKVCVTTDRAYNLIADECGDYKISLQNCKTVSLVAYCSGQLSVTHTLNMPTAGMNVVNLRLL